MIKLLILVAVFILSMVAGVYGYVRADLDPSKGIPLVKGCFYVAYVWVVFAFIAWLLNQLGLYPE